MKKLSHVAFRTVSRNQILGLVFLTLPILFLTYSDAWILRQTVGFRDRVRTRDQRCVVLGIQAENQDFDTFHAAHIFPFAHLDLVWLPCVFYFNFLFCVFCFNLSFSVCIAYFSSIYLLIRCRSGVPANGVRRLKTIRLSLILATRRFILSKTAYFCRNQPIPSSTSTRLLSIQT